jgi:hypothetical protein
MVVFEGRAQLVPKQKCLDLHVIEGTAQLVPSQLHNTSTFGQH